MIFIIITMEKTYNTYKLSDHETDEFCKLISNGFGSIQIANQNSFGLRSLKTIRKISIDIGMWNKLHNNNLTYKSNRIKSCAKEKRDRINKKNIDELAGYVTECVIDKKFSTGDLKKVLTIPPKQVVQLLKHLNLYEMCVKNGEVNISNIARVNGRKAADILRGIELKPITELISNRFIELKAMGLYKTQVYEKMREEFGFGDKKINQLCKKFGYPPDNPQTGNLNSMFGKSPSLKAGIGVKCWINHNTEKVFCRSSLELRIYLYLIDNNIQFELSNHRIKYDWNGKERTYNPDIVIDTQICEIKPSVLVSQPINIAKHEALTRYCESFGMTPRILTEGDFDISKYKSRKYIDELIVRGMIEIDEENSTKLKKYSTYDN